MFNFQNHQHRQFQLPHQRAFPQTPSSSSPPNPNPDPTNHTLQPNHITRYIYPSLLTFSPKALILQPPTNSTHRSRPLGRGDWGADGSTFVTISPATMRGLPSGEAELEQGGRDKEGGEGGGGAKDGEALAKAMARVTKYQGNTVLESGKFARKKGVFVYVVRRRSCVVIVDGDGEGGGKGERGFVKEEETYVIDCGDWWGLRPEGMENGVGWDGWWMRLHVLYRGGFDRAFWSVRDQLDKLGIPAPLVEWRPRPDVERAAKVYRDKRELPEMAGSECSACFRDWFDDGEYACKIKCGHWFCLECLTRLVDTAGRGDLFAGEQDVKNKFWRCPNCRDMNEVLVDRAEIINSDELQWWRWRIARKRLEKEIPDTVWRLELAVMDGWLRPLPPKRDARGRRVEILDGEEKLKRHKLYVRVPDAVQLMEAVPVFVAKLLPWGFSLDNPVYSKEGQVLKEHLVQELQRLAMTKQVFNIEGLKTHMIKVGERAFRPVVVQDVEARLGNPIYPPGYLDYRAFLCEWTARLCFYSPSGRVEILQFMKDMEDKKGAWWKDVRDVFFKPGQN